MGKQVLKLKVPRDNEFGAEAAKTFFSGLLSLPNPNLFKRWVLGHRPVSVALEIGVFEQTIHFLLATDETVIPYLQAQLLSQYPQATLQPVDAELQLPPGTPVGQLKLVKSHYYPLQTFPYFKDADPLSPVLGLLSKAKPEELWLVQLMIKPTGEGWKDSARKFIDKGIAEAEGKTRARPDKGTIEQKINLDGFDTVIRLVTPSEAALKELAGSFGFASRGDGNSLRLAQPATWRKKGFVRAITERRWAYHPRYQVLNIDELATLWHLPTKLVKIPNIAWAPKIISEPPEDLPVVTGASEEEKQQITVFGQTQFKNQLVKFGIKPEDRRRHFYLIGKTGTGKSTTIANMAIDDMKKGKGLAIIDPHGDLCEVLLDFIPSSRINDVCYFNPADTQQPVRINPLQVDNPAQAELVASGIVSILHKLYHYSWGPRLEHILRNTLLTLVNLPQATLLDVTRILTDERYRRTVIEKLDDQVLKRFWQDEFAKMGAKLQSEAISPILNKVGQFVTSPLIRRILEKPTSTVNLEEVMNQGKILIANLSQGKLGEDNAALLGAMLITKLQLAAMNRVNIPEQQRRDFYLYVDEFQNFATQSFIKILSEARKYRLDLILANQYMAQLDLAVQKAIFGNAGTLVSFLVGADDARALNHEFGEMIEEKDLVSLSKFQIITRLAIDDLTSQPFVATTLPLPRSRNQNRAKVLRVSRERYGRV